MNKQMLRNVVLAGIFAIPFVPFLVSSSLFFPFITTKAFAFRIIVEIVFAVWAVLALSDSKYRPRKSIILYAVLTFVGVVGLADLFGVAPALSFWSNFERMEGFVSILHLGAYFLVVSSMFNPELWKRWWNTSLVASLLMVGHALLQLLGAVSISQGGARVDGTFGNATYLAVYLLFHVFIALYFMAKSWGNQTMRYVYGALIFSQVFVLYHTATRGALLGLIGGVVLLCLFNFRNNEEKKLKKVSIGIIGGLVVFSGLFFVVKDSNFVMSSPVLSRFATLSLDDLKTQGRYFVWPMAWEGFKENPILGWGQENFIYVFQQHYVPEMYALEPWFDRAHNIFLDWAVAGGFLGLLAYLALYITSIFLTWSRSSNFSILEKSILTALLGAYFFHNLFVFDHLVSYILFFSLLAYLHSNQEGDYLWQKSLSDKSLNFIVWPVVIIFFSTTVYFINIKPLKANWFLIEAMKAVQTPGRVSEAPGYFEDAYNASSLGKDEIREHIAKNSANVLASGEVPTEVKNNFYSFAKDAVLEAGPALEGRARYQLLAGSFLAAFDLNEESLFHLDLAKNLMPGKQAIYFEIGSAHISNKEPLKALAVFKEAYAMAPQYLEAKIIYLVGAIYANDRGIENQMIALIPEMEFAFDDRIVSAYYVNQRIDQVRSILESRKVLDPANSATYDNYLKQL